MLVCSYREKRKMQVFCLNKSKIVSQTRFQFTFHRICLPSLIEFIWIPFEIDGVKAVLSLLSIVPSNHLQPFPLRSSNRRLFPRTFLSCLVFRLSSKEEEIRRCFDRPDFSISTIEKGKVVDGRVERYAFNFYPSLFFRTGKENINRRWGVLRRGEEEENEALRDNKGGGRHVDVERKEHTPLPQKSGSLIRDGGPTSLLLPSPLLFHSRVIAKNRVPFFPPFLFLLSFYFPPRVGPRPTPISIARARLGLWWPIYYHGQLVRFRFMDNR